ncbi:hypothetical protein [Haladaptatus sp. DFWS20]|uniref:hypothetical protein n=1 Tax=Haladaptatus sp. DFWS20 TaxID=3403467 RepID=UPI003EC0ED16
MVRTRSPSSHYPYPSLETVGNDRANEGATAHQNMPRSRLHFATPVVAEYGRWHGPCHILRKRG